MSISRISPTGSQDLNIELKPKDVISVPVDQTLNVFVYGEVRTPGVIPYLGSKRITLLQAIAQAGGTNGIGQEIPSDDQKQRQEVRKEMKIRVNLKSMISGRFADIVLEEGDVMIVP